MAEGNENSLLPEVVTVVSEEEGILQRLHNHQVAAGKVGGSSRSDKKRLAVKENLKKARAKRWPGREASNQESLLLATALGNAKRSDACFAVAEIQAQSPDPIDQALSKVDIMIGNHNKVMESIVGNMEVYNGGRQAEEAPSVLQSPNPRRDGVLPQDASEPDRES